MSNVSAQLAWDQLTVVGGILTGYKITVSISSGHVLDISIGAATVSRTVPNLQPFTDYTFSIAAVTGGGVGTATSVQKRTCQGCKFSV